MCLRYFLAVTLLVVSVASGGASAQSLSGPEPLALVGANLVDVRTGRILPNAAIVLRNGRIESVGTGPAPSGMKVLDLRGRYVLPGLIDAHAHIDQVPSARRALESGVTTVRSATVGSFRDVALRELVKRGALAGPDVLAAGIYVDRNLGGNAADAALADPELADLISGADTIDKLRRIVRSNLAHGADVIKTRGTARAGLAETDPREQALTETELRAIVAEAAAKGVAVEAHAHGDEGGLAAVRAGVRSIEHGTYLSATTLALMKERGTYFVPTYSVIRDIAEPGGDYNLPALQLRGQHMLPRIHQTVKRAHEMGVKVVAGSDTGYGPESLIRISHEIANFVAVGFTPLQAIQSATTLAAELLQRQQSIGAIEVGYEADLIAVEGNPLDDVVTLQDMLLVVSNGRIALDRLNPGLPTPPTSDANR